MSEGIEKKRIVYYDWNSLMQQDMLLTLQEAGYEVVHTRQRMVDYLADERFEEHLVRLIRRYQPEFCFSFNYFPVMSAVCLREGVRYVSWVFDSPALTLYHTSVNNSCNRIFFFDRGAIESLRRAGAEQIYHLPLAARPGRTEALIESGIFTVSGSLQKHEMAEQQKQIWQEKFLAQYRHHGVTMVGRIYDKKNLYDQINYLPDSLRAELESIMAEQAQVWEQNFLEERLTAERMQEISRYVHLACPEDCWYTSEHVFAHLFLGQKLTATERQEALLTLGKRVPVRLYSDSVPEGMTERKQFTYAGTVDSDTQAPLVFRESKINLNLTLRSILTGIPLRVFDIIEAGGFVLSNAQQELTECFDADKEIVLCRSMEELEEKAVFYLEHDALRQQIAEAGHRRLCAEHTLAQRLERMLQVI